MIKRKKIGIDARFYGPIGKGLGRYTQEIVDNILKIDSDHDYVIFLRKENINELIVDNYLNVKKVATDVRWYSWKEQLLMPYYIWREKLDLVHFPHFNVPIFVPVKFIVTIHDLILTKFKTVRATTRHPLVYNIKDFFYRIIIKRALRKSKKIITVSDFTKNDIISQFGVNPEKIEVTYEGSANLAKGKDSLFASKLDSSEVLNQHNIDNPFCLYVGNAYPHKNLFFLIENFKYFYQQDNNLRLVLVGKEDYFYKELKDFSCKVFSDSHNFPVIFAGYVPDEQLEVLYKKALVYIFPSKYEGFGLPPLEAMARGCPVLSSNTSSMPEVLGGAALYFDPSDKDDFIKKLNEIIRNEDLRSQMIDRGLKQAKKYNWWDCAFKTFNIYLQQL